MTHAPTQSLSRSHRIAAWGIVALGAVLRYWGITAGAPFRLANDEPFVVGTALRVLQTGDFNPNFFDYGGLSIYLHTLVAACRLLLGEAAGEWWSVDHMWIGDYVTLARIVTAAMGVVTVFLVYRIGMRIGPSVALLGALVMAVMPPHVRESHFALTDTPLTMLTTLVLLLSLRASERARPELVALAGFVAGLAASVKYNGGLSLLMPMMSALVLNKGWRAGGMALAAASAAAGFLLTSPYTVIDLRGFLEGFARLTSNYTGPRGFFEAAVTYGKHLRGWFAWHEVVPLNLGFAGLAVSLAGCVLLAFRRGSALSRTGTAILLVFPLAWFVMVSELGSLQYGRYLLPMAPVLCLGMATAVLAGWRHSAFRSTGLQWGLRVVLLALLVLPVGAAVAGVRDLARTWTGELAAAFLVRELPNETLVVEAAGVSLPPFMRVHHVPHLIDFTADQYRERGLKYLVTTAAETGRYFARPIINKKELAAFRQLVSEADLVTEFLPSADVPGPGIRVLRLKP